MVLNVNGLNLNALNHEASNEEKELFLTSQFHFGTHGNGTGEAENRNGTEHHHPFIGFEPNSNWLQTLGNFFRPNSHQHQEVSNSFPTSNMNELFIQHRQEMANLFSEFMDWYRTRTPHSQTSTPSSP